MSADFYTKDFKGYSHLGYIHVCWRDTGNCLVDITPDMVAQFQEMLAEKESDDQEDVSA